MTDNTDNKPILSKRELEVLQVMSKGLSNQEIAQELFISPNTVRVHLRNIYEKLQVQSRTEATFRAIQEGWVLPDLQPQTPETSVEEKPQSIVTTSYIPLAPKLAFWQRAYFFGAVFIALLVFATPTIKNVFFDDNINIPIPENTKPPVISTWKYQTEMPTARSYLTAVAYNNQLYLIGGDRKSGTTGLVEIFDPASKTWQEAASKPTLTAKIQGLVINNEIYVPGGCINSDEVTSQLEIFNPETNEWRTGQSLPEPRCAYAATLYQDEIYLIGGWDGGDYVDTIYVYNVTQDQWRLLDTSPYPVKVGYAGAVTIKDKIYVAGGYDGQQEYADVYVLDMTNPAEWQAGTFLQYPRGGLALVTVGEVLYAIGGGWTNDVSTNERLNIGQGETTWQEIDTFYQEEWRNFGVAVVGAEIYAVGGWREDHLDTIVSFSTMFRVFIPVSP